jgi:ABC-type lipoprotein release transport system permease subunit
MRGATETVAYIMWLGFALTVMLAALALALTVSGVFSVLSYITEQRRKEIGVRLALGATPRDIVRLVMTHTAKPVGLGALAGAWLACGLAALLLNLPVGPQGLIGAEAVRVGEVVRAWDPTAYALGLSVILSACAVAALIPALRAARVDPTQSLKQE